MTQMQLLFGHVPTPRLQKNWRFVLDVFRLFVDFTERAKFCIVGRVKAVYTSNKAILRTQRIVHAEEQRS